MTKHSMTELRDKLQLILDTEISSSLHTKVIPVEELVYPVHANVTQMIDAGIVANQSVRRSIFKCSNQESKIAKIETYYFPREYVGYIHWIYLDEAVRGYGLARTARKKAISLLSESSVIYSEIHSEKMKHIAKTQGYGKTENYALEGWFVSE